MFRFGVDYYPEHWPQERWFRDAQLMEELGVNTVRMAEFAWSFMEIGPDEYDFAWLDQAIDILSQHGIQVILGTPTGSPPPWIFAMYPDMYRVKASRRRAQYGGRRDYCPSHKSFIERCEHIITAMANHYAKNPNVIGWQTDNEFSRLCYCDNCRAHFQEWLQEKYGTLEALNQAWGTAFWSHVYTDWTHIPLPEDDGGDPSYNYGPNPAFDLDFRRFTTDAIIRFQQVQIDILRAHCPEHFITHNTGFGFEDLNFFDITRPLDFVSLDYYPRNSDDFIISPDPHEAARFFDLARGLKGQNFWMTEQQAGQGGMQKLGRMPQPGELRLWTYQSIAHGADAIIYFRWRTALFGAEQYWHGVLDHHGEPGARYQEISQVSEELERIAEHFQGAEYCSKVAIIWSWESMYALQNQPHHPDFDYLAHLTSLHTALNRRNINVDIIPPDADLTPYQFVVAPTLYVLETETADHLKQFVEAGGYLLLTARSGVKDTNNNVVDTYLPGLLADLCGVQVDCYEPLPNELDVPVELNLDGKPILHRAWMWADILEPTTAKAVAHYQTEFYAGRAAATLNQFGKGQVLYLGTFGDAKLHDIVIAWMLKAAGIKQVLATPEGVEATERQKNGRKFLFLLNHSNAVQEVHLPEKYFDLFETQVLQGSISMAPKTVRILRAPHDPEGS